MHAQHLGYSVDDWVQAQHKQAFRVLSLLKRWSALEGKACARRPGQRDQEWVEGHTERENVYTCSQQKTGLQDPRTTCKQSSEYKSLHIKYAKEHRLNCPQDSFQVEL